MRKITEDMHLSSFSPAKIIILDEFHKVSDAGQNCLLKALEDTPSHVYFVLCSSEPNKIIRGIKTRCTTVNFSKIDEGDIFDLLKDVCKKEGKKVKSDVLDKIAEICDGSARQALVLLESMIATQEGLQLDKLAEIEYGTSSAQAIDIVRAIYDYSSWKDISNILLSLKEAGADGEGLRRATLGYGVAILLKNKYNSTTAKMVDCFTNNVYDSGFNGFVSLCAKAYDCRKNTTEATF
jgi:DNA polymerase III gamma/tau subunit